MDEVKDEKINNEETVNIENNETVENTDTHVDDINNKSNEVNATAEPEIKTDAQQKEVLKDEVKKTKKKSFFKKNNDSSEEIEKLKLNISELNDKLLRNVAEFDNYKKRTLKEKSDLLKYGSESVLVNLLQIIDDVERAGKSINESSDIEAIKTGINLIYTKFNDFLTQQGIKEIVTINQDFNTDLHEAVTRFPAPKEELKGKIIDVVQKGYTLNDKVIRFAKVVIGE